MGAIRTLIEAAPDKALVSLEAALLGAAGGSMGLIRSMVDSEQEDRALRATVFGPLVPLFSARPDSLHQQLFPTRILSALWRQLKVREPAGIASAAVAAVELRPEDPAATEAYDQLCVAAAALVRSDPDCIFRAGEDPSSAGALALYLDLTPLARRTVARLPDWLGRATEERVAALKLVFKDAVVFADDATPRLLEIVLAHLAEPQQILRLISAVTDRAGDRYLASSELASFGERLIADAEARIARIKAFQADDGFSAAQQMGRDVAAVAAILAEMDQCVELSRDGPWGQRVGAARKALALAVESRLRDVDKAVANALPLQMVRIAGRMTRPAPRVEADPNWVMVERARAHAGLLEETRPTAGAGGYGALRNQVAATVTERLETYADELLHLVNAGEAPDEDRAQAFLEISAELIGWSKGPEAAQVVRRRAAVAGERQTPQQVA